MQTKADRAASKTAKHFRRLKWAGIAVLMNSAGSANAQATCGWAVAQLQNYVYKVNQVANYEFNQGIAIRCNWNQQCGYFLLGQLNQWYLYQAGLVNNWYNQLARQCSSERAPPLDRGSPQEGINENQIEELEVDDEDRTVALRIPDNPRGFNPR